MADRLSLAEAGVPRREDSVVALVRCRTRAYVARFLVDRLVDLEGLANVNDLLVGLAVDYQGDTLSGEIEVASQVADGLTGGMVATQKDDQVRLNPLCHYTVTFLPATCERLITLVYPIIVGGDMMMCVETETTEYNIKRATNLSALHAPPPMGRVLARSVPFFFSPALGRGGTPLAVLNQGAGW